MVYKNKEISEVYYGNRKIESIWLGGAKVFGLNDTEKEKTSDSAGSAGDEHLNDTQLIKDITDIEVQ